MPSRQVTLCQAASGRACASCLAESGLCVGMAAHERGRPTAAAPRFGRQRRRSRRPQAGRRLDADDVGQAHLRQSGAEGGIDAVAGIGQHHAPRHAGGQRRLDLVKRDLRLGAEDDILRDARFGASVGIVGPALRQIEPVGDRQARMVIRHRQAHRDLAVVLLAELAAILPCHADRMLALLGKAGVVDDPGADRSLPLERRQHLAPHHRQHRRVRPIRLRHEVMQRLMRRLHATGRNPRRHRLDALALARQQQPRAIGLQRRLPVSVAERRRQGLDIGRKSRFTRRLFRRHEIHRQSA